MDLVWSLDLGSREPSRARDEAQMIAASLAGEPDAFSDLVRLHQHRVFKLVGRFFRRREDVEDMAQETFLTAWRKLGTYKAKAPFEHWLTRVCLNCCYARLRRSRPAEEKLEEETIAGVTPDPGAALEVEQLLRPLAPRDSFLLLLLEGEGWSGADIAKRLGWSQVNVRVRAHRARQKLRKLVEQR